jgi:hypothetical protein
VKGCLHLSTLFYVCCESTLWWPKRPKPIVDDKRMHSFRRVVFALTINTDTCPLLLFDDTETWIFSRYFQKKKKTQIPNFTKIHPVRVELLHSDGQTQRRTHRQTYKQADITKLAVAFRSLTIARKKHKIFRVGQ